MNRKGYTIVELIIAVILVVTLVMIAGAIGFGAWVLWSLVL